MEKVATRSLALEAAQQEVLLELLRKHVPQAEVWAYGSRVHGTSHEGSDLDLVLRHPGDLSRDVPGLQALKAALQASDLPMLVDVHQWSRLPQAFHANIEAGYVDISSK